MIRFVEQRFYLSALTVAGPGLFFFRIVFYLRDARTNHLAIVAENMTTFDAFLVIIVLASFLTMALSAAAHAARNRRFFVCILVILVWPLAYFYAWLVQRNKMQE